MPFQHALTSREFQQITDMLYVRQMAETFLSTLILMFISSCYFIHNACRDTESDIVIQMTLEHVLVQRFKKKELDEKITFNEEWFRSMI